MTFRFVHISDLHLPPLPRPSLGQIANKRLLGYLSWHRKRKHRHRPEVVAALEKDLAGQGADHIYITGDITNLGLPLELDAADRWLAERQGSVTFVPGNHDAYVTASIDAMRDHFHRWMPEAFPFVHRRGEVLFIGLSTAVPTPPLLATGRVGRSQLSRLGSLLDQTAGEESYRVLLLHHPPRAGIVGRRKALTDAERLGRLLEDKRVDLILHGHGHRAVHYEIPARGGAIPVFGAGSASLTHPDSNHTGHYHVFELNGGDLRVMHRRFRPDYHRFESSGETTVTRTARSA